MTPSLLEMKLGQLFFTAHKLILVIFLLTLCAASVASDSDDSLFDVDLLKYQNIEMRDGVVLSANVYRPRIEGKNSTAPVIVYLTPYIKSGVDKTAWYLSRRGFNFVVVDARGRGDSGGIFRPFIQEAQDGHDIVEWAAKQSWSNGQVGMLGGSYVGYTQWATLKEFPVHLE
ncbi:MAG: CocE/NonD family hydrolase, partial [Acidiferrobacterales bacterium]|nr:CocE/NonD family hydrolase [Acidiferrobacterales bacterium]